MILLSENVCVLYKSTLLIKNALPGGSSAQLIQFVWRSVWLPVQICAACHRCSRIGHPGLHTPSRSQFCPCFQTLKDHITAEPLLLNVLNPIDHPNKTEINHVQYVFKPSDTCTWLGYWTVQRPLQVSNDECAFKKRRDVYHHAQPLVHWLVYTKPCDNCTANKHQDGETHNDDHLIRREGHR